MAQGNYKVNESIDVVYQARNTQSALTAVTMVIYDETFAVNTAFPDVIMTEIGSTGRYYGSFTPDSEGTWNVLIANGASNKGKVIEKYLVVAHNIDSIGDAVAVLSAADSPAMLG